MAKEKLPTFKAGDRFETQKGRQGVVLEKGEWYSPYAANMLKGYRVRFEGMEEELYLRLQYMNCKKV